jgi:hypothetical protein
MMRMPSGSAETTRAFSYTLPLFVVKVMGALVAVSSAGWPARESGAKQQVPQIRSGRRVFIAIGREWG